MDKDLESEIIQVCTDIYYECKTIKELDRLTDKACDLTNEAILRTLDELLEELQELPGRTTLSDVINLIKSKKQRLE